MMAGLRVFAHQPLSTVATRLRLDIVYFLDMLDRYLFPGTAFVSWLRTPFASTPSSLARLWGYLGAITGWGL